MIIPANKLPPLNAGTDVPLVPGSGIQFLDVPLGLEALRLTRDWYELPRQDGLAALRPLREMPDDPGNWACEQDGRLVPVARDDERAYTLDLRGALLPFLRKWVPVPFLQVEVDGPPGRRRLSPGPSNWARLHVVQLATPDEGGFSHRAVLAFDTTLAKRDDAAGYLAPREGEPGRFALATRTEEVAWLLNTPWMQGWLAETYRERDSAGQELPRDAAIGCRHFAAYLTLLDLLERSEAIPSVRLIDLAAAERENSFINVDLVLDLGNSRSCGFLVEETPGRGRSIADACRLSLRDLSMPEVVSDLPFESRVEFAQPAFGKEEWSLQSRRSAAFEWPSPVRVGPEAVRLSALNRGNEGETGLSSPKRYLWDEQARLTPWRFNPATAGDEGIRGSYLRHLTEDGTVKSLRTGTRGIALRPLFSHASLFTLFLLEVLLQARAQVNSYAARYGRHVMAAPRRLGSLVLTLPPAMPLEEVRKVRERARAATHLLRDVTGDGLPEPQVSSGEAPARRRAIPVEARLDEATATQIVYLYDQITRACRGNAQEYVELAGRPRPGPDGTARPALRIASIDVGGGTTDLAIHTYTLNARVVMPHEEFREGFRLAGDDVLEAVVMRHVMPPVMDALAEAGLGEERARQFLVSLFRVPAGTAPARQARRLALSHLFAPAALGLLTEYESWDPMVASSVETRLLGALLAARAGGLQAAPVPTRNRKARPAQLQAAAWFNEQAAEAGAHGFDVVAATMALDFPAIHETVMQTLGEVLEPLCEMVYHFDCDVLLLSGRGARWPGVLERVRASLAIEPQRIQPMHRYRIGAWYPFADGTGRIFDPKTTVAVGAMLHRLLRGGQLTNLALVDRFAMRSTARHVGIMESDRRILDDHILFRDIDTSAAGEGEVAEATATFSSRCFLGFKQFAAERWPASALYRLDLAPSPPPDLVLPLSFTLRRELTRKEDGDAMELEIDQPSVVDATEKPRPRALTRTLQTLPADEGSQWLDSGQLATLDVILATLPRHR
ncbi:conserved protein of unknown function [Rhodovastum atsumiense]|uniref:Virulence factor SrfB n=1 Tax=Rhodovastum atsumiense TaxID=504468 RepID=A0A5M6IVD7_9PROT|nr:virulence factor SrfB [Rhodovastum atsumiense]KAA5612181.1 hypothetical protein F1189_10990 [Rhodovastum atsumiense]CAH2603865.1 conserved protein of unknown function [Rhodovastum atsumiense]